MENISTILWIVACALLVPAIPMAFAMGLFGGNRMPVDGKTVLLTGTSEGMGRSVAQQLAAKGANLIIVSRNVVKLEEVISELKAAAKNPETQRFHYISADVSVPNYAAPLLAEAIAWNDGRAPDIVWCVAGMATPGIYTETPFAATRRNMDVNFYGQAEMSHAILCEWLRPEAPVTAEPKHLIFTTSVVAFFTIAGYGPYAPSKFAIRGLADTLSQEVLLYPQKVKVHVVFPGTILSPGLERENLTKPEITHIMEKDDPKQTPDVTAAQAIRGLERGDYFVTVSWIGDFMKWGALGGSLRNNWIVDIAMSWLASIVWIFVLPDLIGRIRKYAKNHGHPSTYGKREAAA